MDSYCQGTQRVDHSVGGSKLLRRMGGSHSDNAHPCIARGIDSTRRVFYHDTGSRRDSELCSRDEVALRVGLAVAHLVSADHHHWYGETDVLKTVFGDCAVSRGYDGPAIGRQRRQQRVRTGYLRQTLGGARLLGGQGDDLGCRIQMRRDETHRIKGATAVGRAEDGIEVESVSRGPHAPGVLDRYDRVYEHTVEIEDEGLTGEPGSTGGHAKKYRAFDKPGRRGFKFPD